jgi:hypothetical protein
LISISFRRNISSSLQMVMNTKQAAEVYMHVQQQRYTYIPYGIVNKHPDTWHSRALQ